jgi:hypothetical protein
MAEHVAAESASALVAEEGGEKKKTEKLRVTAN